MWVVLSTDPAFVGSAFIQESLPNGNAEGDDDKVYFFFSEAGKEFDFFDNTIVSRIARVCKVRPAFIPIAVKPLLPTHWVIYHNGEVGLTSQCPHKHGIKSTH